MCLLSFQKKSQCLRLGRRLANILNQKSDIAILGTYEISYQFCQKLNYLMVLQVTKTIKKYEKSEIN